jgi:phosphohistidine phosphatase
VELILWRHADAEEGVPDAARALTAKGHKQAKKMAQWLERHLPSTCKILVSPTVRTQQTAQALERRFKTVEEIGPGASAEAVLAAAGWPDSKEPVLVVGHQPTLGRVAALLLTGKAEDCTIRKANVWWIVQKERGDDAGNYLKAAMSPELVTK